MTLESKPDSEIQVLSFPKQLMLGELNKIIWIWIWFSVCWSAFPSPFWCTFAPFHHDNRLLSGSSWYLYVPILCAACEVPDQATPPPPPGEIHGEPVRHHSGGRQLLQGPGWEGWGWLWRWGFSAVSASSGVPAKLPREEPSCCRCPPVQKSHAHGDGEQKHGVMASWRRGM